MASQPMRNPVLIELTRGALVESAHAGAVAVVRADGEVVAAVGDIARPVFPRSAIKPLQALPFLESGAADRFGFGAPEIALASGSHAGAGPHITIGAEYDWAKLNGSTSGVLDAGVHIQTLTARLNFKFGPH